MSRRETQISMRKTIILVTLCGLVSLFAAGCSGDTSSVSKSDIDNFKGKPMPADVKAKMQQQMSGGPAAQKPQ